MKTECRNCAHTRPGPMTKHGMQSCALGEIYIYFKVEHTCEKFKVKLNRVRTGVVK